MEKYYYYVMAVHIIFVVSWMAGLFYSVRLFIYHTEAEGRNEPDRSILKTEYERMESKLWHIITTPAMVLTVLAGVVMVCTRPWLLSVPWFHVKLGFVVVLLIYHFICQNIMKQLKHGKCKMSSFKLRLWNEVATILLVAIVFTVVLKNAVDWIYGLVGLIIFAVVIMLAVKWYKHYRKKHDC
ncbi:protoporphyrinogen oxidase HemJ [Pedobacter frigoris]|uniref:Protoporphyrinogen IX oxidase n=1 Tax=Pedobacter frigoris TaxID=2571272 RepID=A0A4U1CM93_9SPHI|nr:protoporphyrinogen oxidase HemJ [Pedobacter frigoris]TKC08554.1 protoporphyrinogen oxidase HemJ [Pedobacter frigoris]